MSQNNPPKIKTVVQGEASESEEDEEEKVLKSNIKRVPPVDNSRVLPSKLSSPARRKTGGLLQAVVVAGEASESDEEELDTSTSENGSPKLPPLKVDPNKKADHGSASDLNDVPMLMSPRMAESRFNRPKYDTLLHRKLRENNWQLHEHLMEVAGQAYLGASRSLAGTTAQLVKSHTIVQDISHNMRLLTNDLFHLDDCIDIIQSCKLLPDINIPNSASADTST